MKFIDTHAHVDQLQDIPKALRDAFQDGVEDIVAVSMNLDSCRRNLEVKKSMAAGPHSRLHLAFGTHPAEIDPASTEECIDFIRSHHSEIVAIGEIGLDFWYKWVRKDKEKHQQQREAFLRYLEIAKEFDLPAVIHSRGTWRECLETVQKLGVRRAVFHWYSGPIDVLKDIIKGGYFVSTTPSLAYSPQSREAIAQAPVENTLIETDCPVVFKDGEESFTAEPKDVRRTLKIYAGFKKMDPQAALEILNGNAKKLFGIS